MKTRFLLACIILTVCTGIAFAQKFQPAGEEWIEKWYSLGLILQTGGHNASATTDWISEGTKGKVTDESLSTPEGLRAMVDIETVSLKKDNGGDLEWEVVTIDPLNSRNMSVSHGEVDLTNFEWYGIIVIDSPSNRTTTMHPAHDDYAHIWLNGEKVYDNPDWTGGVQIVTRPTKVSLNQGENILVFRCGESGGDDYINLHFEVGDADLKILPTTDNKFLAHVKSLPVEPVGKLATTWGTIKERQ